MARLIAHNRFVSTPRVSPLIERNDLTRPEVTRYKLTFGTFEVLLDEEEAELLHQDLSCRRGDPEAHARGSCAHFAEF